LPPYGNLFFIVVWINSLIASRARFNFVRNDDIGSSDQLCSVAPSFNPGSGGLCDGWVQLERGVIGGTTNQ
jgi:hypothetical protein